MNINYSRNVRQPKNFSHKEADTYSVEIHEWDSNDVLFNSLHELNGRELREKWLDLLTEQLRSNKLLVENSEDKILDLLELCFKDKCDKVVDVAVLCAVSILGRSRKFYDEIIPQLVEYTSFHKQHLPALLVCLALHEDSKNIQYIVFKYIVPRIEELYTQSQNPVEEEDIPIEEVVLGNRKSRHNRTGYDVQRINAKVAELVNLLEMWQFSVSFCSNEKVVETVDTLLDILLELIGHEDAVVRPVATSCLVTIAEMQTYRNLDTKLDLEEVKKSINAVLYSSSLEWDDDSKVAIGKLLGILSEAAFIVAIPDIKVFVTGPTATPREIVVSINRKGYPVSGYSQAIAIRYIHDYLAYNFSLFLDLDIKGVKGDFTQVIISIIMSNPVCRNLNLHVDSIRTFKGRFKQYLGGKVKAWKASEQRTRKDNVPMFDLE